MSVDSLREAHELAQVGEFREPLAEVRRFCDDMLDIMAEYVEHAEVGEGDRSAFLEMRQRGRRRGLTLRARRVTRINRASVLTLWAAVVAERLGSTWETVVTVGQAVAGMNAHSKGVPLGIVDLKMAAGRSIWYRRVWMRQSRM